MFRPTAGDVSGAVADLGVLVPLSAALVLVNGLDAGSILLVAGLLVVGSGVAFGLPFPVQPLKALTALAVAQGLGPDVIHAAGLQIGAVLVLLACTGMADRLSRVFTKPVIRSLQFGVGSLLVVSAVDLVRHPPEVFDPVPPTSWALALAAGTVAVVGFAAHQHWYGLSGLLLALGIAVSWVVTTPSLGTPGIDLPDLGLPPTSVFGQAFVLLVIPQIPLTYGNAVVGVSDLAHEHFGKRARRVTPGRVALSAGLGNLASAGLAGMPMCHGSSGLSAHIRLGGQTAAMNVLLGSILVTLGLFFSDQVLALFGLLPIWALAGFLAYAGLRHAMLVLTLRRHRLAIAVAAGLLGIVTGNLMYTTAAALVADQAPRLGRIIRRGRNPSPTEP